VPSEPDRLLWLLRHAKTLTDPPKGGTDHERRLGARGQRDASALGARLGDDGDHLGFAKKDLPTAVLCSTATRTTQTAERVLADMSSPPAVTFSPELYSATVDGVLDELGKLEDDITSVMVVGHNPTAAWLAGAILSAKDKPGRKEVERRGLPTCALAVYRLPIGHWYQIAEESATLLGLFTPPY